MRSVKAESEAESSADAQHDSEVVMPKEESNMTDLLVRSADRFGWPTILLVLVLYWARTDLVKPLIEANSTFINSIVSSQRDLVTEVKTLGVKLDTLIEVSGNPKKNATP